MKYENMTQEERLALHDKLSTAAKHRYSIPEVRAKILAKCRKTKKDRYGCEKYTNIAKRCETKMKKYGDPHYSNRDKARKTQNSKSIEQKHAEVERRLSTRQRHAAEDPSFIERTVVKSIETRKRNNGDDYTGRNRCRQTLKNRYGIDNPMRIPESKEKIRRHSIETYGVEWHIASSEIREKSRQTCQKNYGVDNPFASREIIEQMRQHSIDKYGVECSWQRDDVKQKIKDTNRKTYGYEHAMQNPKIRAKAQANIRYGGVSFDSYPELCVYLWAKDNQIPFTYQPTVTFQYEHDGITHQYCPDFEICGLFYEIKGDHFFKDKDKNKEMVCPWDHSKDALYEAKHLCMLENGIIVLTSLEYQMFITYAENTYGREFYARIKAQKEKAYELHAARGK